MVTWKPFPKNAFDCIRNTKVEVETILNGPESWHVAILSSINVVLYAGGEHWDTGQYWVTDANKCVKLFFGGK